MKIVVIIVMLMFIITGILAVASQTFIYSKDEFLSPLGNGEPESSIHIGGVPAESIHIYVCNDSDAQGYEGGDSDGGFNNDDGEFTSSDYNNITVDNNNYVSDIESTDDEYQYHRFNFTIDENIGDITQIDITWKGYGGDGVSYRSELWVKDVGSWNEKTAHTQNSKHTLTTQKTSGFDDWVSAGHLECAVQSGYCTVGILGADSILYSYYVEVAVTYNLTTNIHILGGHIGG